MASGWNLWAWLQCIGVASRCCCKEVYRYPHQGFIQDFKLGGGNPCFVEARQTRGVWGHAPPRKFLIFTFSVVDSDAFWVEKKTGA